MNCSLARRFIDEWFEGELGPRERSDLEAHLASCPRCAAELRGRQALERRLRQALAAAVHQRYLPSRTASRLVEQGQAGLRSGTWAKRARSAGRLFAACAALTLVVVGVSALLGRIPLPRELNPVTLFPIRQFERVQPRTVAVAPARNLARATPQPYEPELGQPPDLTLRISSVFMDPPVMQPGDPFTMTLVLYNALPRTIGSAHVDLDISGPTGHYRFPVSVNGPFAADAVFLLNVTPGDLSEPCQEKYQLAPSDIFGVAGTYNLSFALVSPVARAAP